MNAWNAFRTGLTRARRYPWVLLILFAVNLASALLLAALPALGLAAWLGHRPAMYQAADGTDAWLAVETLLASLADMALGQTAAASGFTQMAVQFTLAELAAGLLLPVLAWLPTAFLTGGVLLAYAESPSPFRLRRFLWGCWRWFGAFLLLGLVQGIVFAALLLVAVVVSATLIAALGGWPAWVLLPLLALFAAIWLALFEYTRIVAVVEGTRNVARTFGWAVRFLFRRPLALVGLYGLALLLLGLVHVLFRWGLLAHLPLTWWPLVLAAQQAFVLARLWARLVRLAGGTALYCEMGRTSFLTVPANRDKLKPILECRVSPAALKGGDEPGVTHCISSDEQRSS